MLGAMMMRFLQFIAAFGAGMAITFAMAGHSFFVVVAVVCLAGAVILMDVV